MQSLKPELQNGPFLMLVLTLKFVFLDSIPTKSSAGGIFLYIAYQLSDKPRHGLDLYKANQLESTAVERINPKK